MSERKFNRGMEKPIREIIWRTPQEIDVIRLQHEIDEMLKGAKPAYRLTRPEHKSVHPTHKHFGL